MLDADKYSTPFKIQQYMSVIVARPATRCSSGTLPPQPLRKRQYFLEAITTDGQTTDATSVDGVDPILQNNSTWTYTATATAHRTDFPDGHAGYRIDGVAYRQHSPGTTSFQGKQIKTVIAESDTDWDINISINSITGGLTAQIVGQPGKIIKWAIIIETIEVTN